MSKLRQQCSHLSRQCEGDIPFGPRRQQISLLDEQLLEVTSWEGGVFKVLFFFRFWCSQYTTGGTNFYSYSMNASLSLNSSIFLGKWTSRNKLFLPYKRVENVWLSALWIKLLKPKWTENTVSNNHSIQQMERINFKEFSRSFWPM